MLTRSSRSATAAWRVRCAPWSASRPYEQVLGWGKRTLKRGGAPGQMTYDALHGLKTGLRDVLRPFLPLLHRGGGGRKSTT